MPKPWSEVEKSKEYASLPDEEKSQAKEEYFSSVVEIKPEFASMSPDDQSSARSEFMGVENGSSKKIILSEEERNIKEPFPFINFIPGGKKFNSTLVQAAEALRDEDPVGYHRLYTLKKTKDDIDAGIVEGVTGGIPRALIAKATGYEMNKGNLAGRIMGSIVPVGMISKSFKAPSIIKNAVEGAVASNLVEGMDANDFLDVEKRMKISLVGGGIGIISPGIIKAGVNTAKAIVSVPKYAVQESEKVIARLMKATHIKDYAFGKNPPKAVIEALGKDLPSTTAAELYGKIGQAIPKYVDKAKQLVAAQEGSQVVNLSEKINGVIDESIDEAVQGGKNNQALVTRLTNLKSVLNFKQSLNKTGKVMSTGEARILDGIKPSDAVALKQEIGGLGKWTGNASDDGIVNTTTLKLYGIVRNEIEKVVPGAKAVNETLSGLLSADTLMKRAAVYEQGAPMFKGAGKIVGSAGILYGLASQNPIMIKESIAVLGLNKIAGSVEAQTKLAYGLSRVGKEAQIDIFTRYPSLKKMLDPTMKKFANSPMTAVAIANARLIKDRIKESLPGISGAIGSRNSIARRIAGVQDSESSEPVQNPVAKQITDVIKKDYKYATRKKEVVMRSVGNAA